MHLATRAYLTRTIHCANIIRSLLVTRKPRIHTYAVRWKTDESEHTGESVMREIRRNGGVQQVCRVGLRCERRRPAVDGRHGCRLRQRCGVFQARPLAAPALRNRMLCKAPSYQQCQLAAARTPAGRKSGTRRSGAAARAASTRTADSSEVPSVVLVSLLERFVLRKSPPTAGLF